MAIPDKAGARGWRGEQGAEGELAGRDPLKRGGAGGRVRRPATRSESLQRLSTKRPNASLTLEVDDA